MQSWGLLGVKLNQLGTILNHFAFWFSLSGPVLGGIGANLGELGANLGEIGANLRQLGPTWGELAPT